MGKKDVGMALENNCIVFEECLGRLDPAHIKTRGAGNGDQPWNIMPLCRKHHTEQHQIGWFTFAKKYINVLNWLRENGWRFIYEFGRNKLVRDKWKG